MSEVLVTGAEAFETAGRKASPAPGKHRQKLRREAQPLRRQIDTTAAADGKRVDAVPAARHRNGGRAYGRQQATGETASASIDERTDAWESGCQAGCREAQATSCTFSRTMARDCRHSVETAKVSASAAIARASKAPDDRRSRYQQRRGGREHGANRPNSRYVGPKDICRAVFTDDIAETCRLLPAQPVTPVIFHPYPFRSSRSLASGRNARCDL